MKEHSKLKEVEDITGLELKDALMELYEKMGFAAASQMPICKIKLHDGTIAKVFITITTNELQFLV